MKMIPPTGPKKQTQTNPISNPTLNFLSARGNFPSWFGPGKLFIAENGGQKTEDRGQFFVMMCFALSIRYSH